MNLDNNKHRGRRLGLLFPMSLCSMTPAKAICGDEGVTSGDASKRRFVKILMNLEYANQDIFVIKYSICIEDRIPLCKS